MFPCGFRNEDKLYKFVFTYENITLTLHIIIYKLKNQMLTYNKHRKPLVLPEYGRNIQNMLDHCLEIENREQRTLCARSIIDAMSVLFPAQGDKNLHRLKLWDHLAIMSDFKLDVDLHFELLRPEEFEKKPDPVAPGSGMAKRKVYGCHLELMVSEAAKMPEGDERDELIYLLANHMKKMLLAVNPEGVEDEKVFRDLYEMTDGQIRIEPGSMKLYEFRLAPVPGKKKKKK